MHKLLEISFRILIVAVADTARTLASGRSYLSLGILANWGRKSWPQLTTHEPRQRLCVVYPYTCL